MKIKLNRKREQGLILLGVILIVVAVGLGGCALIEMIKRIEKIEDNRKRQETNCLPDPELVFDLPVPDPGLVVVNPTQRDEDDGVLADGGNGTTTGGGLVTTNGVTNVGTNWYNPALEDETGF